MEVPILYYNYRCHIRHYDDPNLRKIIQLHIQVCEEIGNRECLPVEGDLITLAFECKGEEQFFYDWLNEGAVHNGGNPFHLQRSGDCGHFPVLGLLLCENRGVYECRKLSDDDGAVFVTGDYQKE